MCLGQKWANSAYFCVAKLTFFVRRWNCMSVISQKLRIKMRAKQSLLDISLHAFRYISLYPTDGLSHAEAHSPGGLQVESAGDGIDIEHLTSEV